MTSAIVEGLEDYSLGRVLFWSGAGISIDPPCQGPDGDSLSKRVLGQLFAEQTEARIAEAYSDLNITSGNVIRKLPRLETLLDVAVNEYGLDILPAILDDLVAPNPNTLHRFFANHVNSGGHHVTVNFDTQIENAGGDPERIVHVHGVVGDWERLGARLSIVEAGIQGQLRERLRSLVTNCAVLVFVGYGGRDYFDVDIFLREIAAEGILANKSVIWLDHLGAATPPTVEHRQIEWFKTGGADVRVLGINTILAMAEFADQWNIPEPENPPAYQKRTQPLVRVGSEKRQRATTRLYAAMGLHLDVKSLLAGRSLDEDEEKWAAQAAWAAGHYEEYAAHWRRGAPGSDSDSWAVRAMHDGASFWLRGQLRLARNKLSADLEKAERLAVSPTLRLELAETLGRVLQHMRMLPDTRLLVTRSWRRRALLYLEHAENELTSPPGIHLRNRVDDVRLWLKGEQHDEGAHEHVKDFDEAEALNAMLNFRHGELRKLRAQGRPPSAKEYLTLEQQFRYIGANGDAARVPLLPGAASAFKWREVRRGFAALDFTRWHRTRLQLGWFILQLRDQLKIHRGPTSETMS